MTPQNPLKILAVTRVQSSTSLKNDIFKTYPLQSKLEKIESKLRIGFFWDGGPCHGFLEGWFFEPYRLRFRFFKQITERYENCLYGMTTDINYIQITILKIKSEKLYWKLKGE